MIYKIPNGINCMHEKKINKLSEICLIHDILKPYKRTKMLNTHYSPIPNECMSTRKGRAKFKYFRILLVNGCSSTIVIGMII